MDEQKVYCVLFAYDDQEWLESIHATLESAMSQAENNRRAYMSNPESEYQFHCGVDVPILVNENIPDDYYRAYIIREFPVIS